jgi:hypothetical protein
MNLLLNLLNKANPAMGTIAQVAGAIKAARDPMAAVSQMAQSDPRMKQVADVINHNGGNVQQAVYALARQKGIDVNEVLKQAQTMLK